MPISRYDTNDRQHYLVEHYYSFKLKPRLLYVGTLNKNEKWGEDPHSHEFAELLFVVDGKGIIKINENESREVKKGDIVIYNAGVIHAEHSSKKDPLEIVFIGIDKVNINDLPINHLLPPEYDFIYETGDMYDIFMQYFKLLLLESDEKEQFHIEIVQNATRTLIMYLFRLLNRKSASGELLRSNDSLNVAVNYIEQHFLEDINLDTVANACYINKFYLAHLFKTHKNMSVGKYIFNKRINEAKRLLYFTDMSISDVAGASGFNDFSYFCRAFKKACDTTPLQFRKQVKDL